ncbi:hypothetical protein LL962_20845 [Xanthomonas sp. NCPPB 1067]|uniref:hypothetical protein n=1 Tax=Xanthomonas TaxID=338 RepID=UPI001E4AA8D0|nr:MULTISPECIES: hypothetical protein [Xanthomonas]MCC4589503.1 hypothetical protein [Xanthomonas sp. NCPPB 1067]MCD0279907.1 hypothetical protein [Xanthomonas melonis]
MKVMATLFTVIFAACISSCTPGMELIPRGQVTIYKDIQGDEVLGTSSSPLPVKQLVYLDKTDYVVEVAYQGNHGYVRGGGFNLSQK